jgi:hypothetical protein
MAVLVLKCGMARHGLAGQGSAGQGAAGHGKAGEVAVTLGYALPSVPQCFFRLGGVVHGECPKQRRSDSGPRCVPTLLLDPNIGKSRDKVAAAVGLSAPRENRRPYRRVSVGYPAARARLRLLRPRQLQVVSHRRCVKSFASLRLGCYWLP